MQTNFVFDKPCLEYYEKKKEKSQLLQIHSPTDNE